MRGQTVRVQIIRIPHAKQAALQVHDGIRGAGGWGGGVGAPGLLIDINGPVRGQRGAGAVGAVFGGGKHG